MQDKKFQFKGNFSLKQATANWNLVFRKKKQLKTTLPAHTHGHSHWAEAKETDIK